jgi:hypothetical protein
MLSSRYISSTIPDELTDLYAQLELDIIIVYAVILGGFTDVSFSGTALILGNFRTKVQLLIDTASAKGDKILRQTFASAIEKSMANDERYYKKLSDLGVLKNYSSRSRAIPAVANEMFKAQSAQMNLINAGIQLDSYNRLNSAFAGLRNGALTREQAVSRAVSEFADDGIRVATFASGRKMELAAYIRMVTTTSVSNAVRETTFARMAEVGIDLMEVSAHSGARPLCEPYQGQVYSVSGKSTEYPTLSGTSYGQPAGLFGINCRHTFWAYSPDYPRPLADRPDKAENDRVYKESQAQRYNERQIRAWKRKAMAFDQVKGAERQAAKAYDKVKEWQARQRALINSSGLKRDYVREKA